jgi:hypothetical protein
MILVALLTEQEKNLLVGQLYDEDSYFNPAQDADNNWYISTQEIENNIYPEFNWIQNLSLIEYKPKPQTWN